MSRFTEELEEVAEGRGEFTGSDRLAAQAALAICSELRELELTFSKAISDLAEHLSRASERR